MKRLLSILSAMALLLSLCACGSEDAGHFALDMGNSSSQTERSDDDNTKPSGNSILIAYDPAQETVAQAADILADALSGDLQEIEDDSGLHADAYEYVLLGFAPDGDTLPQTVEAFLQRHDFGAPQQLPAL